MESSLSVKIVSPLQSIHPINLYASFRHAIYKYGLRSQIHLKVPVVSIGNIVFGGSGKTPMVLWFLERYSSQYKIAVISQSYATQLESPHAIQLSDSAQLFGDEAVLIKRKVPQVDVWSGPVKALTAVAATSASSSDQYDFILVDDGFTHHQLYRDLDLVLIDVSRSPQHFRLPPFGQLRESCLSLFRAHGIIFTKVGPQSEKLIQSFKELLLNWNGMLGQADYQPNVRQTNKTERSKYLLFSGVGNFEHVVQSAERFLNFSIQSKMKLPNHFEYSKMDQDRILKELKSEECRGLTTEKDLVKIQNQELVDQTDVLEVKVKLDENTTRWIDEKIRSLL